MNLLDALYLPAAVVTAPWWARKTRAGWSERFGRTPPLPYAPSNRTRIMLHAVSVGEVGALRSLVPLLLAGGSEVVLSAGTDTGLRRARELFGSLPAVYVVRYPLDFSRAVSRFLDAVRPDAVALVELEVWPNFVAECAHRGVPVCVINGRLSARSFRGYSRFRRFFRPVFSRLAFAAVQDSDYAERFAAMGVPRERIVVSGSMKWDAASVREPGALDPETDRLAAEMGIDRSRPVIVAGSTASTADDCEEAILSRACPEGVQLVCAPRRPEHFDAAFEALGGAEHCVRRSERATVRPGTRRFLLDTIGELRAAYALADVAFVGRSFGEQGGSDPIEPIALGKPVVMGPRFSNFEQVVRAFRDSGALRIVNSEIELAETLAALLNDPPSARGMAEAGARVIRSHQGASARHSEMVLAMARASHAGKRPS